MQSNRSDKLSFSPWLTFFSLHPSLPPASLSLPLLNSFFPSFVASLYPSSFPWISPPLPPPSVSLLSFSISWPNPGSEGAGGTAGEGQYCCNISAPVSYLSLQGTTFPLTLSWQPLLFDAFPLLMLQLFACLVVWLVGCVLLILLLLNRLWYTPSTTFFVYVHRILSTLCTFSESLYFESTRTNLVHTLFALPCTNLHLSFHSCVSKTFRLWCMRWGEVHRW